MGPFAVDDTLEVGGGRSGGSEKRRQTEFLKFSWIPFRTVSKLRNWTGGREREGREKIDEEVDKRTRYTTNRRHNKPHNHP